MTETELTIEFDKACSNYIPNRSLEKVLYQSLQEAGIEKPNQEEKAFAEKLWATLSDGEKESYLDILRGFGYVGDGSEFEGKYLAETISAYEPSKEVLAGSTDVSDVSWVVPTAQLTVSTSALGTPLHTWQMTTQGISSYAHKGMLRAAEAMALTAIKLLTDKGKLEAIKKEFEKFKEANPYTCPIPAEVKPSTLQ